MDDIKTVKSLEESDSSVKGVRKIVKKVANE